MYSYVHINIWIGAICLILISFNIKMFLSFIHLSGSAKLPNANVKLLLEVLGVVLGGR